MLSTRQTYKSTTLIESDCFKVDSISLRYSEQKDRRYIVDGTFSSWRGDGERAIKVFLQDMGPLMLECYDIGGERKQSGRSGQMRVQGNIALDSSHSSSDKLTRGRFSKYSVDWNGQRINLAEGIYLVAMLSDSCLDCAEMVNELNHLYESPGCPLIVGLFLGEKNTLRTFQQAYRPQFPTRLIPDLEFFSLIGNSPPRFIVVKDGRQIQYWDKGLPEEVVLNINSLTSR